MDLTPVNSLAFSLTLGEVVAIIVGCAIPFVLWAINMRRMIRELLDMHRDPALSAATSAQHALVKELYESTAELHTNNTKIVEANTRAIQELAHFIRWFHEEAHGKKPPPPISSDSGISH